MNDPTHVAVVFVVAVILIPCLVALWDERRTR